MDSQDARFSSQQSTNDTEDVTITDSRVYGSNMSMLHSQTPQSNSNPFLQSSQQFATQSNHFNLQFQPHFGVNRVNAPYPPMQQSYGTGLSYQGHMNAQVPSFESSFVNSSKGPKQKPKTTKSTKNVQPTESLNPRSYWKPEEDVALTKAYLNISIDSIAGKDQTYTTMWNRIYQVWKDNMGEYDESRNVNELSCRWGKIQAASNKFHGLYETLERTPRSGTSMEDVKKQALRMFKETGNGKPFKYEHCWEILRKNAKWCSQQLTKTGCSKKQKTVEEISIDPAPSVLPTNVAHGENSVDPGTPIENSNADGIDRPLGRRNSKENRKRMLEENSMVGVLNKIQCTLEKQLMFNQEESQLKKEKDKKDYELREQIMKKDLELKEKAQQLKEEKEKAKKRKEQERILNINLNDVQPHLRDGYAKMQSQIMKEWEKDGLFGDDFGN